MHTNSSKTCNCILMAAKRSYSPVIIRISYATCLLNCGEFMASHHSENDPHVTVAQAVALALHVRTMASYIRVPVILQSETRCHHRLIMWYDGLLEANKAYFAQYKEALYSSHILDLTGDLQEELEILAVGKKYLEEFDQIKVWLGLKVHYSQQSVWNAFDVMSKVSNRFSIVVSNFQAKDFDFRDLNHGDKGNKDKQLLLVLDDVSHSPSASSDCDKRNEDLSKLASTSFENFSVIQVNVGGGRNRNSPSRMDSIGSNKSVQGHDQDLDVSNSEFLQARHPSIIVEASDEFKVDQYVIIMRRLNSENTFSNNRLGNNEHQDSCRLSFWDFVDKLWNGEKREQSYQWITNH